MQLKKLDEQKSYYLVTVYDVPKLFQIIPNQLYQDKQVITVANSVLSFDIQTQSDIVLANIINENM